MPSPANSITLNSALPSPAFNSAWLPWRNHSATAVPVPRLKSQSSSIDRQRIRKGCRARRAGRAKEERCAVAAVGDSRRRTVISLSNDARRWDFPS
jgi:hypothetical protein